jgi:hypothetical protein
MLTSIRTHVRTNLVGYVALFIALGGSTYAAATIGAGDVKNDAIRSRHIKTDAVKSGAIKANQVKSAEVADGSLVDDDVGVVATGSFNLASVPAGTCTNAANVSIPGADGEDLLLVVPTDNGSIQESNYDTGGELVMSGIPHPGEAHVKVCNVSGGAIDPGLQAYRILLIEG